MQGEHHREAAGPQGYSETGSIRSSDPTIMLDQDIVEVFPANSGLELQLEDPSWSLVKGIMMPARLMAVQITVDDHPEPFLGLVDSGASHSIMNHAAAKALGYNLNSKKFKDGPGVNGFGIMGKQKHMPTVSIKVLCAWRCPGGPGLVLR